MINPKKNIDSSLIKFNSKYKFDSFFPELNRYDRSEGYVQTNVQQWGLELKGFHSHAFSGCPTNLKVQL